MSGFDMKFDVEFINFSKNYDIEDFIQKPIAMKNLYSLVGSFIKVN
jgi:hypothetical protein